MITIHLSKLQFYSFHGFHNEERILGNNYEVNVTLTIERAGRITAIEQTVNYETLFEMIRQRMKTPALLLETIAQELVDMIQSSDERIKTVQVNILKKYPPQVSMEGEVSVTCYKEF